MDLYIGYSSESDAFLLGYCHPSRAVRSEAGPRLCSADRRLPGRALRSAAAAAFPGGCQRCSPTLPGSASPSASAKASSGPCEHASSLLWGCRWLDLWMILIPSGAVPRRCSSTEWLGLQQLQLVPPHVSLKMFLQPCHRCLSTCVSSADVALRQTFCISGCTTH